MNDEHLTIHDLPDDERPRERLLRHGAATLSSAELLAILLRTGSSSENVLQLATRLLAQFDGLSGLVRANTAELTQIKGLGTAKATQLLAAFEIGLRINRAQPAERPLIREAQDAAQLVIEMAHLMQEQVRVILLDNASRVIAIPTVYVGTVNMSVLRVSEIYREAILRNAPALILAHNHPSGDATPSPEDVELTRAMIAAGKLLDIHFVDHLIIAQQGWKSLREMGLGFSN